MKQRQRDRLGTERCERRAYRIFGKVENPIYTLHTQTVITISVCRNVFIYVGCSLVQNSIQVLALNCMLVWCVVWLGMVSGSKENE